MLQPDKIAVDGGEQNLKVKLWNSLKATQKGRSWGDRGEKRMMSVLQSRHILYSYFIVSMIIVSVELSCMSPLYRDYFSSTVKCSVIFNIPEKDLRVLFSTLCFSCLLCLCPFVVIINLCGIFNQIIGFSLQILLDALLINAILFVLLCIIWHLIGFTFCSFRN